MRTIDRAKQLKSEAEPLWRRHCGGHRTASHTYLNITTSRLVLHVVQGSHFGLCVPVQLLCNRLNDNVSVRRVEYNVPLEKFSENKNIVNVSLSSLKRLIAPRFRWVYFVLSVSLLRHLLFIVSLSILWLQSYRT